MAFGVRLDGRLDSSEYCKPWEWRNTVQTLARLIVNTRIYVNCYRTLWLHVGIRNIFIIVIIIIITIIIIIISIRVHRSTHTRHPPSCRGHDKINSDVIIGVWYYRCFKHSYQFRQAGRSAGCRNLQFQLVTKYSYEIITIIINTKRDLRPTRIIMRLDR